MSARGFVVLVLALVGGITPGCNCNQNGGRDGGYDLTLSVSITGEGEVDVDGAVACTSATDPCSLTVTPGTATVTAIPSAGYGLTQWSCDGTISTASTLELSSSGEMHCTVVFSKLGVPLQVVLSDGHGGIGGVVTSSAGGIDCGGGKTVCSATFEPGTKVTLTAAPAALFSFVGWEGDCAGTSSTIELTLNGAISCIARFVHLTVPLSLSVVGEGTLAAESRGALVASCSQVSCASVEVDREGVVTLTATPSANHSLVSWSGDCVASAMAPSTTVMMDGPKSCAVTFGLADRSLSLTIGGTGKGLVTTDPTGTSSGGGSSYVHGTVVRLAAIPDGNSDFSGWQGDCSGSNPVVDLTLDADKHCTAVFSLKLRTLTVVASAHGSVSSTPSGIDTADGKSSATYTHGTIVSLAATPDAHYEAVFSGACLGTGVGVGNTSSVTMDADKSCVVTFRLVKHTLTATPVGSGSIASVPAGIDTATGKLAVLFDYGTTVTLTATPNAGGQQVSFVGWSGDCGGTNQTVVILLDANKSCTARFTVTPYDLAVTLAPTVGGSVTGAIVGGTGNVIACGGGGADCGEPQIPSDETVTLVATPAAGYRFERWSNCSTDTATTLSVPMSNTKSCTANFVKQWSVTVTTLTGPGSVAIDRSSTGVGIDRTCAAGACSQLVDSTETVAITAAPGNSTAIIEAFTCTAGSKAGDTYTLMSPGADVTCTAVFHQQYSVAVAVSGAGGTVTSTPSLITGCTSSGGACSALFLSGASVVLVATPNANMQAAWTTTTGGTCDGSPSNGAGRVKLMTFSSLDGAKACTATFSTIPVTVNGRAAGANGTVAPPTTILTSGSTGVTLTATPATNYHVNGWTGAFTTGSGTATGCTGSGTSVAVSITDATPGSVYDCTATFAVSTVTVNGRAAGANGTVAPPTTILTSGGAGVTLTATPAANDHVGGWTGAFTSGSGTAAGCTGNGTSVTVSISAATNGAVYDCTATFAVNTATVSGRAADTNGTVTPGTTVVNVGGAGATLTATPATNYHVNGWTGAFTSGSGTATGCTGSGTSVTVSISAATNGAVYDCTATFAVNTATVSGRAADTNGTVTPGTTVVNVGGAGATLTATPATNYHVSGWTGAFTSGSGTAAGCSGSGTSVTVNISAATDGAVYDCTATFAVIAVTVSGRAADANGTVTLGTTVVTSGGTVVTLTATPATSYRVSGWTGAFTSGSGTAAGCSGSGTSVTVSVSAATDGAVYDCTATFLQQSTLTVRVVPGPSGTTSFGLVSSPCTIAIGSASCSTPVDTGSLVTLTTAEATNALNQDTSRFVKWACSNGASSTSRSATTAITADTTCVAQFYGLWSRYSESSPGHANTAPNVAVLAPGAVAGLPTSSSTFVLDGLDSAVETDRALAGWIAADDEWGGPKYTSWTRPQTGAVITRVSSNGDDAPSLVGSIAPAIGRSRGVLGPYLLTRDANDAIASFDRGPFTEYFYPDPPPVGTTSFAYDTAFNSGRENGARSHALGGLQTSSSTYPTGPTVVTEHQNAGWIVLTDAAGAPTASGLLQFPSSVVGTTCASPYTTIVNDILWDPDTANPGGVVVVGQYSEVSSCTEGASCPPDPTTQHTPGFIAKLGPSMNLISMRSLALSATPAGDFQAQGIQDNLTHSGYVVFGEYAATRVGILELRYDLSTASAAVALAPSNQVVGGGDAVTTYADAIVDRVGNRYLVLVTATFLNATNDVVIMSLDDTLTPIATDGWRFGTTTLDEAASRIIQAPEGGFLFTGHGPTAAAGAQRFWATRTDERFNVPFNGTAPVERRVAPLVYGVPETFLLAGSAFTCAGWVDNTMPSLRSADAAHATFAPVVSIQAP